MFSDFIVKHVLFLGVPSQPSNLRATDIGETSVTLQWSKPTHSGENIVSYELYWNDTYAKEKHHRLVTSTCGRSGSKWAVNYL